MISKKIKKKQTNLDLKFFLISFCFGFLLFFLTHFLLSDYLCFSSVFILYAFSHSLYFPHLFIYYTFYTSLCSNLFFYFFSFFYFQYFFFLIFCLFCIYSIFNANNLKSTTRWKNISLHWKYVIFHLFVVVDPFSFLFNSKSFTFFFISCYIKSCCC